MTSAYGLGVAVMAAAAIASFVALLFVPAPYGRHHRPGWGPAIPARIGWVVMESPSVWLFAWVYAQGRYASDTVPLVLLALWQLHYLQRTLVFPLRMRPGAPKPLVTVAMALGFNLANAWLNAAGVSGVEGPYAPGWAASPRFVLGVALFALGFGVNLHSDAILRRLRKPGETGYRVPQGGLFRWVTSPNYLGEIVEWCGFALAAGTWAAAAFALFTAANLVPRALTHHRWYRERFPDYPRERRAILPGLL